MDIRENIQPLPESYTGMTSVMKREFLKVCGEGGVLSELEESFVDKIMKTVTVFLISGQRKGVRGGYFGENKTKVVDETLLGFRCAAQFKGYSFHPDL